MVKSPTPTKILLLLVVLYLFILSIKLMGTSFGLLGRGVAETLVRVTSNPFVGLFIGILATSILQSSSTTTSITVGIVAAGGLSIQNAIPIIMGANVGTTVTNTIVSLGHVRSRGEFRRAFAGATVHDFFNLCTLIVLFPLEYFTHMLQNTATLLAGKFVGVGGLKFAGPLELIVKPIVHFTVTTIGSPVLALVLSLVLLFLSLTLIVKIVKSLVITKFEVFLDKFLFKTALNSFLLGLIFTAIVQSSSITTSLVVPLVGAGILTVNKIFPYTLGANVGTTVTALLASFVTGNPAAVIVAFAHMFFNIYGILLIYSVRSIPISLAEFAGKVVAERRYLAFLFIAVVFFLVPLLLIIVFRNTLVS